MEIPMYSKHDLDSVPMTGQYELTEFDQYIEELKFSNLLNHSAAIGIVKQVSNQGTIGLSDMQLKALQLTTEQFVLEHCIKCSRVIVVRAGEEPGFCETCQNDISAE